MAIRELVIEPSFEGWREAARRMIAERVPPADVLWREVPGHAGRDLFRETPAATAAGSEIRVPRAFVDLARDASRHPDPARWAIIYDVLWRIAAGGRDVLSDACDEGVARMRRLARETREGLVPPPPAVGAAAFVPPERDLDSLRRAASSCRGCDLYRHATQTVFGVGPATARAVLVGEQPGDQEDRKGAPFVGPAGEVLDRALVEAGIPREDAYVTNAVKHFKFVSRRKRRIHQTPGPVEIGACRPWLEAELAALAPRVLVCLGATAAKAIIGPDFRLLRNRGRFVESPLAPKLLATYHPSAVLRADDEAARQGIYAALVEDLRLAARAMA
ncbi:MAG: UdgX family uracil-DNA binding protein [Acidobacteriota bacterium]